MLLGEFTQQGEITLTRQDKPHIARDRLYNNRCDLVAITLHDRANGILIVVRHSDCIRRCPLRHTWRAWHAERRQSRSCTDKQTVTVPVIAADKFYNFVTPRIAASQTKCTHCRLCP